jgi:hypothetical protein
VSHCACTHGQQRVRGVACAAAGGGDHTQVGGCALAEQGGLVVEHAGGALGVTT